TTTAWAWFWMSPPPLTPVRTTMAVLFVFMLLIPLRGCEPWLWISGSYRDTPHPRLAQDREIPGPEDGRGSRPQETHHERRTRHRRNHLRAPRIVRPAVSLAAGSRTRRHRADLP